MTTEAHTPTDDTTDGPSDPELITAVRTGDTDAYATLYQRHHHAAVRLAHTLTHDPAEADDLVAEAFTRILATLQTGKGPDLAFRAYLHTTLRNTFHDRTQPTDQLPEPEPTTGADDPATGADDPTVDTLNRTLATQAFHTLPERWQLVLWHTEVEGDTPATIAPLLGLTPNGVAALAYRARERLRQAYLQAHLGDAPAHSECATVAPLLAAEIRDNLAPRDQEKVTDHLASCDTCPARYAELTDLNDNLAAFVAPAVLGATWEAYLGTATAPAATGGLLATLAAWPGTAASGVRQALRKAGPRNTAIGAGTAAAVAAAAVAAILLSTDPAPPAELPKAPAAGPEAPSEAPPTPSGSPASPSASPQPPGAVPPDRGTDEPGRTPTKGHRPKPTRTSSPPLIPDPPVVIEPTGRPTLTSGRSGVLPIAIEHRGSGGSGGGYGAAGAMALDVRLPSGVRLTGHRAGDGWRCERSDLGAHCTRPAIGPGESTVAQLRIHVSRGVTGEREVTAAVSQDGERTSRTYRVRFSQAGGSSDGGPHRGHDRRW